MRHSTSNAILTKLSTWEYGNEDASLSQWKSGRVSCLVCYGAPVRFRICVYGAYRHAHTKTSRSPQSIKCADMLDTCRIHRETSVTWWHGSKQSPQWSCTQYSINMHLRQSLWAHTHTIRSKAFMTREGHSRSFKSPSYKVHNHPHTCRQIYIYIYTHTYIMHNATTQSGKINQTLPMFQGYGPVRYRKCKIDTVIPRERGLSKEQENKMGYMEGDPNTCSREEA